MGKSTISMAIFNSYEKLPEGRSNFGMCFCSFLTPELVQKVVGQYIRMSGGSINAFAYSKISTKLNKQLNKQSPSSWWLNIPTSGEWILNVNSILASNRSYNQCENWSPNWRTTVHGLAHLDCWPLPNLEITQMQVECWPLISHSLVSNHSFYIMSIIDNW